jgi:hypothetical protein
MGAGHLRLKVRVVCGWEDAEDLSVQIASETSRTSRSEEALRAFGRAVRIEVAHLGDGAQTKEVSLQWGYDISDEQSRSCGVGGGDVREGLDEGRYTDVVAHDRTDKTAHAITRKGAVGGGSSAVGPYEIGEAVRTQKGPRWLRVPFRQGLGELSAATEYDVWQLVDSSVQCCYHCIETRGGLGFEGKAACVRHVPDSASSANADSRGRPR